MSNLTKQIDSLLELDAKGALSPHGIGGLARELLEKCKAELNTRAVPVVPELVRYLPVTKEAGVEMLKADHGDYVLYSQAAEIIAAKEAAFDDEYNALVDRHNQAVAQIDSWCNTCAELEYRAEAAEAKLAQYEAQEPVAWLCEKLDGDDRFSKVVCNPLSVEKLVELGGVVTPLYALPAPAADLKAENDRKDNALRFYADISKYPAPLTGGMGALWEDCGQIARDALGENK